MSPAPRAALAEVTAGLSDDVVVHPIKQRPVMGAKDIKPNRAHHDERGLDVLDPPEATPRRHTTGR